MASKLKFVEYEDAAKIIRQLVPHLFKGCFVYLTPEEVFKGRETLLTVLDWLLDHLDSAPLPDRELFYNLINSMLNRSELDIASIKTNASMKIIASEEEKLQFAKLKCFLLRLFVYVIEKLGYQERIKAYKSLFIFCYQIMGRMYFWLGFLTGKILSAVWSAEEEKEAATKDPDLNQFVFKLTEPEAMINDMDSLENRKCGMYFCQSKWILDNISVVCDDAETTRIMRDMSSSGEQLRTVLLQQDDFIRRLKLKTGEYFVFLYYWAKLIDHWTQGYITYNLIPGYHQLVHSFLFKIRDFSPLDYQKSALKTSKALLANNNELFNIYVKLVFSKTNLHKTAQVTQLFNILPQWIDRLKDQHVPESFDTSYFFSILKVVLRTEHFVVISSCLVFIHNYIDSFPKESAHKFLSGFLIDELFFTFHLNWCASIRDLYNRIILYRIADPYKKQSELTKYEKNCLEKIENNLQAIHTQINSYITYFPSNLEVYADTSHQEYERLKDSYGKWRQRNKRTFPKLKVTEVSKTAKSDLS